MNNMSVKIRVVAVAAVIFAAFNATVFILPFDRGGNFWIAYAFAAIAFVFSTAASLHTIIQSSPRRAFHRWPVMYVTWVYLVLQLVSGMIFITFPAVPARVGAFSGVILLSLCLCACITAGGANAEIERRERAVGIKTSFLRSLREDVESMATRAGEDGLKTALARLAEELRYSDPMSDPWLAVIEDEIRSRAVLLKDAVSGGIWEDAAEVCSELRRLLDERNKKCLSAKNMR